MDPPPHFLPFDQHFRNFTYDDIYTHMIEQDQPHCVNSTHIVFRVDQSNTCHCHKFVTNLE